MPHVGAVDPSEASLGALECGQAGETCIWQRASFSDGGWGLGLDSVPQTGKMLPQAIVFFLPWPHCWAGADGWGGTVGPDTEGAAGDGWRFHPITPALGQRGPF